MIGLVACVLPTGAAGAAQDAPGCAGPAAGGDWPSLNHDLHNTRYQAEENTIGVQQASSLVPAWTFKVPPKDGIERAVQSTPVVANGCVYFTAAEFDGAAGADGLETPLDAAFRTGTVFALNADTGELVWQTEVNGFVLGLSAVDGLIYALPTGRAEAGAPAGVPEPEGSHAVALDAFTGEMVWSSERLDSGNPVDGAAVNASPVVFTPSGHGRRMLFVPVSFGGGDGARVPLHFLDARTGQVIKRFYALSDADYAAGYGGSGIWSTAAFDATTNHLYAGTADSEGHTKQHPYNNAILKIDADPSRATFGSVVNAYTATTEHYDLDTTLPGWQNNPVCETDSTALPMLDASASTACLELDTDFGASPNLYVDGRGRTLVSAMQKSGVLHVADTATMDPAWNMVLSAPDPAGNGATSATDGTNLFVPSSPAQVFSFERTLGALNWASVTGVSALSYQPLTAANGVVYTITDIGNLVAFDAATGRMLLQRPISLDLGAESCAGTGAGVAVARHTVFAPCDAGGFTTNTGQTGGLVAYRQG